MRTPLSCCVLVVAQLVVAAAASGQNLLDNGDLDTPGLHESDLAEGWTLSEGPFVPGLPPDGDFDPNTATFANFGDHTTEGVAGGVGLWLRAFVGELEDLSDGDDEQQVFATLSQTVPATPGLTYELSAWSRFEANYPGAVVNLNEPGTDNSDPMDGPPSPTNTFLFMEFLDAANGILAGSVELDLRSVQLNDSVWRQHFLAAIAPPATVNVRVGGAMVDGVINSANPQSAFLDDFSLVVPEPSALALMLIATCASIMTRRRRR